MVSQSLTCFNYFLARPVISWSQSSQAVFMILSHMRFEENGKGQHHSSLKNNSRYLTEMLPLK